MQKGALNYAAGADGSTSGVYFSTVYQVTFPQPFAAAPVVVPSPEVSGTGSIQWMAGPYDITTTGFKFRIVRASAAPAGGTLQWTAVRV